MNRLREPLAALMVAVCALGCDALTLHLLVGLAHVGYLSAATLSFLLGTLVSWALSIRWVFRYRRMASHTMELCLYVGLGVIGLGLNDLVIYLAVGFFNLHYLIGKACAAATTFFCNYLLRKFVLFSPRFAQHGNPDGE
jgi:putative flippase GtrA